MKQYCSKLLVAAMAMALTAGAFAEIVYDIGTMKKNVQVNNNVVLTGELDANYALYIADGATVTISNMYLHTTYKPVTSDAGFICKGDATIILKGRNSVGARRSGYPGIYVPASKTLTIKGTGSLSAYGDYGSDGGGAGIGGNSAGACGNIVIESGTINAIAADAGSGAGIGGGYGGTCGNITIKGGTITATASSNRFGAGIGGGHNGTCGNITINGGTVVAQGGGFAPGIGSGYKQGSDSSCGNIAINGGTVNATGGANAPGIGSGVQAGCGDINIGAGIALVVATAGRNSERVIGRGNSGTCGTITIDSSLNSVTSGQMRTLTPKNDQWDSGDDTAAGGTSLTPTFSAQTHGTHTLSATDLYDCFKIYMTAGNKYVFESTGSSDTYGELHDGSGTRFDYDDDGGDGKNFKITYTAAATQTYYLRVRSFNVGAAASYSLKYYYMPAPDEYDPGDDTAAGGTSLTPQSTELHTADRSLSATDKYDFFKISMEAGKKYVFESKGNYDVYGELFSSTSTNSQYRVAYDYDSGDNNNFKLTYTPTVSQTYYLRVRTVPVGNSAYYTIWYSATYDPDQHDPGDDISSGGTSLTPTFSAQTHGTHTLSATDEYDFFKISMTAGNTYVFESTGGYDMYGELFSSTSTNSQYRVDYDDDGGDGKNFKITYTPTVSQTYYLRVRSYNVGAVASYSLKYYYMPAPDQYDPGDDTAAGATTLTRYNTPTVWGSQTLSATDKYDFFKLSMEAGETYVIESQGNYDTYGELFSSTSTNSQYLVASNDNGGNNSNFKITYTPTVSQTYYLRVRTATVGNSAKYNLKYWYTFEPDQYDPGDDTAAGATTLRMYDTPTVRSSQTLSATDEYDFFKLSMTAGRTYVIESQGNYNTYGELFSSTSTNSQYLVASNDNGGDNNNFKITYTAAATQTYYLRVRAAYVGNGAKYNLRYWYVAASDQWDPGDDTAAGGTSLTPTTSEQTHGPHTLSATDKYDFFKISMEAGKKYVFESTGSSDTYGELYDGSGTRVDYDDDGGDNDNFKITYTAAATQTHYLRVSTFLYGSDAAYSLKYSYVEAPTYKLTLDNQGADIAGTDMVSVAYGDTLPTITVPTKVGYTFGGYFDEPNGKGTKYYYSSGKGAVKWDKLKDATLYARWTTAKYTVTLDNQGADTAGTDSVSVTYGATLPTITVPTKVGYTFGGYFDEPNGKGTKYYYSSGRGAVKWDKLKGATLYARWTTAKYTVTLDNQGATTKGTTSVTAALGASLPQIEVPTKLGYAFGGYFDGKDGTGTKYYYSSGKGAQKWDKPANTTLYAKWTPIKYKISFNRQGATVKGTDTVTAVYGEALPQIEVPTKVGYTFGGYFEEPNGKGTKYYYSSGRGAVKWDKLKGATLYARWTTAKYTVTLDNQGATTKGTTSVTAALGASLPQITVPAKTGYTFAGYFAEPNGKGTKYYYSSGKGAVKWDQTANATLYARWTKAKTIAKLAAKLGSTATTDEAADEPTFEIEEGVLVAVEPNGAIELEVPDTVIEIGEAAFVGCTEVEKVVLPETVEVIGEFAFFGCAALEELVLPTGELEVSDTAFLGCQGLADDSGTITIDGIPFDARY